MQPKELTELQKAISRFHTARNKMNFALAHGTSKMGPAQVAQLAQTYRDSEKEAQAVEDLRDLLSLLHEREATEKDVQNALFDLGALGVPFVVYPVVAGGAVVLTSLFNYLAKKEEHAMSQAYGQSFGFLTSPIGLMALGATGVTAAFFMWQYTKESKNSSKKEESIDSEESE